MPFYFSASIDVVGCLLLLIFFATCLAGDEWNDHDSTTTMVRDEKKQKEENTKTDQEVGM